MAMAKFDYLKAMENRRFYPLLGGSVRYAENGDVLKGDVWINHILKTLPKSELLIVSLNFLAHSNYKSERDKLFSQYHVNTLIDAGDYAIGGYTFPCAFLGISKIPTKKIKIAWFKGRSIAEKSKTTEEVNQVYSRLRTNPKLVLEEKDIKLLQSIPEPIFSDEFITFLNSIQKWVETYKDIIDEKYFHKEVKRSLIDNDRLLVRLYTDEAIEFFKYIENEKFVKLQEMADVFRSCNMRHKKQMEYEVKRLGVLHFTYPIDYSKLYINRIDYEVTYLQKGDIIVSGFSIDGRLRVYLINELPKEKISVSSSCFIIRAKKVSPEYLYIYLKSETSYKYVFYNNPLLSVSLSVLKNIPIAMPSEKMEMVSQFALNAARPDGRIVDLETSYEKSSMN